MSETDDGMTYKAVINHEEQYSVWFTDRENPPGWSDVGFEGSREECLRFIDERWTDIRPRSAREALNDYSQSSR